MAPARSSSPAPGRIRARCCGAVLAGILLALALLMGPSGALAAAEPLPSFPALSAQLGQALVPDAAADLTAHDDDPLYRIRATYAPETHSLDGHLRAEYRNRGDETLTDLGLYTFANASAFHGASLTLSHVAINGQAVSPRPLEQGAAQLIDLQRPCAPGQLLVFSAAFHLVLSMTAGDNGLDEQSADQACLYAWYPVIAGRAAGAWQLHPLNDLTDPCALDMAHVLVELTVPAGMAVASGGAVINERPSTASGRIVTIAAPFTRDLAVVIGSQLHAQSATVGATTVVSWAVPSLTTAAQASLDIAAKALALYSAFGPYPYARLSVVQTPMSQDAEGMESSSLILISSLIPSELGVGKAPLDAAAQKTVDFVYNLVVSHEVAHQWFYNLVGSDPYRAPWLDESLADWSDNYYLESHASGHAADAGWAESAMDITKSGCLNRSAAGTVDSYRDKGEDYESVVYARGGLMYQALRRRLGPQRFLTFLRSWVADHRYEIADQAAWRAAIIQALGPADGAAFASTWLDGAGLTAQDIVSAAQTAPALDPVAP